MMFATTTTATPQSGFPIGDAQFWIVTAIAAIALAFVMWRLFGGRWRRRKPKTRKTSATLTIEGKSVDR